MKTDDDRKLTSKSVDILRNLASAEPNESSAHAGKGLPSPAGLSEHVQSGFHRWTRVDRVDLIAKIPGAAEAGGVNKFGAFLVSNAGRQPVNRRSARKRMHRRDRLLQPPSTEEALDTASLGPSCFRLECRHGTVDMLFDGALGNAQAFGNQLLTDPIITEEEKYLTGALGESGERRLQEVQHFPTGDDPVRIEDVNAEILCECDAPRIIPLNLVRSCPISQQIVGNPEKIGIRAFQRRAVVVRDPDEDILDKIVGLGVITDAFS